jgi:hypothetical protein
MLMQSVVPQWTFQNGMPIENSAGTNYAWFGYDPDDIFDETPHFMSEFLFQKMQEHQRALKQQQEEKDQERANIEKLLHINKDFERLKEEIHTEIMPSYLVELEKQMRAVQEKMLLYDEIVEEVAKCQDAILHINKTLNEIAPAFEGPTEEKLQAAKQQLKYFEQSFAKRLKK